MNGNLINRVQRRVFASWWIEKEVFFFCNFHSAATAAPHCACSNVEPLDGAVPCSDADWNAYLTTPSAIGPDATSQPSTCSSPYK